MESQKEILHKIEQPLIFASRDHYKNLSNIKDLGKFLLNLLPTLKSSSLPPNDDFNNLVDKLLEIFFDYDFQKLELKKNKIEEAQKILEKLSAIIHSSPTQDSMHHADRQTMERISDLKESFAKLNLPVQYLKGVGPKMAARFAAKKIATVEDLLFYLPRTYEDRREIKKINRLEAEKVQSAVGTVISSQYRYYGRKKILETVISDGTANLTAKWFKGQMTYLLGIFKKGTKVIFTADVRPDYNGKAMIHPDYEILDEKDEENLLNFKRIVPIYSETEGLHQKYFRKVMNFALENYSRYVASPIPYNICEKRNLLNIHEALLSVHFPGNNESVDKFISSGSEAHRRLIYDEFFFFQLGMAVKKSGRILEKGISFK